MKVKTLILLATIVIGACSGNVQNAVQHGLNETPTGVIFWVAVNDDVSFLLATGKPVDYSQNENWDGSEFNIFYELKFADRKVPVLVYGDLERGTITAAYDNQPLDLKLGTFFKVREDRVVAMTQVEKSQHIAKVHP